MKLTEDQGAAVHRKDHKVPPAAYRLAKRET